MIHEEMTLGDVAIVLAAAGMKIVRLESEGREFVAKIRVADAHLPEDCAVRHAEGRGATIAAALEDARQGWIGYLHLRGGVA